MAISGNKGNMGRGSKVAGGRSSMVGVSGGGHMMPMPKMSPKSMPPKMPKASHASD